jgi:hypothetical protein
MNRTFQRSLLGLATAVGLGLAVWAAVQSRPAVDKPQPRLRMPSLRVDEQSGATVDVVGLSEEQLAALAAFKGSAEQWAALFSLRVAAGEESAVQDRPAVLGSCAVEGGVLRFRPRFPLARGVRYRAVFDPAALPGLPAGPVVRETLLLPKPPRAESAAVAHVYPSADRLPENLLKFYLHFTAPMSRGGVYEHIHLLGPGGKDVDLPFLELPQELWDENCMRLTLLLDPGRIKSGLKPREDLGPVLEAGKSYTLVVDRDWPDAEGEPLREAYRKTFTAGPADNVPPDPQTWQVQAPPVGTRQALAVTFPEPLDHSLLGWCLEVVDAGGKPIAGRAEVRPGETAWEFTPKEPWEAGAYRLAIDTRLEDRAGNRIGRPFEVDLFHPLQREIKTETVALPFAVAPGVRP